MDKRYFSEKIVKWYENNQRQLPWRATNDPYKIWLSEVILQQTRVAQGLPYYERFVRQYPTVGALAAATEQQVLRLWQGLGYYTRARNLHKCAKAVVAEHSSRFPDTYEELLLLPGVGAYTAAAIASISFKRPVAVVDGNVLRVLSRVFGVDTPIDSPAGKINFTRLANELILTTRPDVHNQAVMEFGATVCLPKNPLCETCIFRKSCVAFERNLQGQLPVKAKARVARNRYFYYLVVEHKNALLMRKREQKDIWLGLFDFRLVEKARPVKPEKVFAQSKLQATAVTISKPYKHLLTHQTIHSTFIVVKSPEKFIPHEKNQAFYTFKQIARLPKPVLVNRFLTDHYLL